MTQTTILSSAGGAAVCFQLSPSCVLKLQMGDVTKWSVNGSTDAIVNATNVRMLGGGGVDGAIHTAARPELLEACRKVPEAGRGVRCPTGEARITPGFQLPVSHVIHTVGAVYNTDKEPAVLLKNAHRYPYKEASIIAISTEKEFANEFKEVHFVFLQDNHYSVWLETAREQL